MPENKSSSLTSGFEDRNVTSAAFIAAGIGIVTMGLLQFVSELNTAFNDFLALNKALGPYSGKYMLSYLAWLLSWAILYPVAKAGRIRFRSAVMISAIFIVAGAILLFPPFIQLFAAE